MSSQKILTSVLLCQVKIFLIPSKENVGAVHKEQSVHM